MTQGSGRTKKSSTAFSTFLLLHDSEHVTRARLQVRQIEGCGIETSQNGHKRDGSFADKRVFVIFEFENLKIDA
jgi:hypothetical protein